MAASDEQCIRLCLDDHPDAFRRLVERYQCPLWRYMRRRLRGGEEADEATQETFVRAYFAIGQLRKPEAFLAWLFGIAERVVKEMRRGAERRKAAALEQLDPAETADRAGADDETGLAEAVAKLPDVYREVVLLRYYGGQSCAEIGAGLGVPLGTVTKRLSRAYALLREQLRPTAVNPNSEVTK